MGSEGRAELWVGALSLLGRRGEYEPVAGVARAEHQQRQAYLLHDYYRSCGGLSRRCRDRAGPAEMGGGSRRLGCATDIV